MPAPHDPIDYEPFGQHGVRQLARPLLVGICSIGIALCLAMIVRSYSYFDLLWKQENRERIEIASAIGRLTITTRQSWRNPQNTGWVYESAEIGTLDDGWRPSVWRTIGIDWGTDTYTTYSGRVVSLWRFRLQWRTLLIVCLAPVLVDAYAKRVSRRRARRHEEESELTASAR